MTIKLKKLFILVLALFCIQTNALGQITANQAAGTPGDKAITKLAALTAKAQAKGRVPVIVRLNVDFQAEGSRPGLAVAAQRSAISNVSDAVAQSMAGMNASNIKRFKLVPFLAMTVNANALQALANNPKVIEVIEDVAVPPALAESTTVIGANNAWQPGFDGSPAGFDGSGWTVAVLDTGVDKNHNFLSGKVVSEACYSTTNAINGSTSVCPGGVAASTAADSALNCTLTTAGCDHGTHVAGIVAGKVYTPSGPGYNGVAKGAEIIAVQVFSEFTGTSCTNYGIPSPCALTYPSDQIAGLERVYELRSSLDIAAVNMSLGGGQYFSNCDGDSLKPVIDTLRAAGIATVIASGNSYYTTSMGTPACISTAISVGSTCDSALAPGWPECGGVDDIASYSNIASFISLLAPGSSIASSVPGVNTFQDKHGTSMAAPHVAGAWALMKQRKPTATVSEVLTAFQNSGTLVNDLRAGGSVTGMRRINVDAALTRLVISNTNDSGAGSLRQGIADAPADSVITFAASLDGATITLAGTQLLIDKNLTIDASSLPNGITISGGSTSRVFAIAAGNTVTLKGLTISGGTTSTDSGGGIDNSGTLTLTDSTLINNTALNGGAIINRPAGTLTLERCTLSGNTTSGNGGAIYQQGNMTLTNTTVSGNTAQYGGGIINWATITLNNTTIANNNASSGAGGLYNGNDASASLSIENTLIAGNMGLTGPDIWNISGIINPAGANLIGDNSTVSTEFPLGPLVGDASSPLDPMLAPLGDNGGPTQTMLLLTGSPAIDAALVTANSPATDQRGIQRLLDAGNDIGALELEIDTDGDGVIDYLDTDDDNDGIPDVSDAFPLDPALAGDHDGDGIDSVIDTDDDGDGLSDAIELANGSDPLDPASFPNFMSGDLAPFDNPDGLINIADLLIATQLVIGQREASALQFAHGDMNGDNVIDIIDLQLIQDIVMQDQ